MKTWIALAVAAMLCVFAVPAIANAAPIASFADVATDPLVLSDPAQLESAAPTAFVPNGRVDFAWGALIEGLLDELFGALPVALAGFVAWMLRKLPEEAAGFLRMLRVDQLLEKAVQYGVNATRGAVKDKVLTVNVGNEVMERALEYALRHAPALLSKVGADFIREKVIARLNLEADAAVPVPRPPADTLIKGEPVSPAPQATASA